MTTVRPIWVGPGNAWSATGTSSKPVVRVVSERILPSRCPAAWTCRL